MGSMRRTVIDNMALLCTLHADGPKTLRLLREAGCTDLKKLAMLGPNRLAKLLRLTPATARRFLREAGLLGVRVDETLEREEVMYAPAARADEVKAPPPGSFKLDDLEPPSASEPSPVTHRSVDHSSGPSAVRDRVLLDMVMQHWRSADESAQEAEAGETPDARQARDPALAPPRQPAGERTVILPGPGQAPEREFEPGDLPGLDAATFVQLRAGEVTSLEELFTCPVEELAERSGLSFTRARALQFHAGRALESEDQTLSRAITKKAAEQAADPVVELPATLCERISLEAPPRLALFPDPGPGLPEGAGGPFG